jgi:hypothetical protein
MGHPQSWWYPEKIEGWATRQPVTLQAVPLQLGNLKPLPRIDFTGYRKIAATCPISMTILYSNVHNRKPSQSLGLCGLECRLNRRLGVAPHPALRLQGVPALSLRDVTHFTDTEKLLRLSFPRHVS